MEALISRYQEMAAPGCNTSGGCSCYAKIRPPQVFECPYWPPIVQNTPKKVNEPTCEWIRFTCDAPQALALEAGLEVRVAPAAPKCWRAALDERNNQVRVAGVCGVGGGGM